jgi:tetratricopeptide (TPR) repeat protein
MKLVRGRTLSEAIRDFHANRHGRSREWAVSQRRLLECFLAVTRTMAFAHEKGVIHRDLKPANIVLGEYGETVILDWGLAKILHEEEADVSFPYAETTSSELTAHGEVMGTPAYMAPEQAGGRIQEIDGQSDIYALGAILYHILTGTHPLGGASTNLLRFIQEAEPTRPSAVAHWVSRPLEAICLKAMSKQKSDRYPCAKNLADDLERFLAGEPVSVYRERLGERFSRWSRQNRTLVATGVVAFVLLTVGGTLGLYLRESAAQKLAFETERRQTREREAVRSAAQNEEARGLGELKAGRYSDARQSFQKGLACIPAGEEAEIRAKLDERHRGAERLASFSLYRERTDRIALVTDDVGWTARDDAVIAACEAGLRNLGVIGGSADWWNHLPDRELPDALRRRLLEDTASSLGLLAMWQTKRGFVRQMKGQIDVANEDYRSSLELLGRVQGFVRADPGRSPSAAERGSPAASALELFCRMRLDQKPIPARLTLVAETAPDLYFLGITHLFLNFAQPGSLESKLFSALSPLGDFPQRSGLDFDHPLITAERMLREAVALDPSYHMAHYWLGRCLMQASNYSAAEQSFNACIALQPQYVPAYVGRSKALLNEAYNVKNPRPPRTAAELRAAAFHGLEKAPDVIRADPEVHFLEATCLAWLNRDGEAITAAADAVEKEIVQQYGLAAGRRAGLVEPFGGLLLVLLDAGTVQVG